MLMKTQPSLVAKHYFNVSGCFDQLCFTLSHGVSCNPDVFLLKPLALFTVSCLITGMDIPNIRKVLHYGPPRDVEQYVQETGRTARDGLPGQCVILYHSHALSHTDDAMKEIVKTKECRRQLLLQAFNETSDLNSQSRCCDNCLKDYSCCSCPLGITACSHVEQMCYCVKPCSAYSIVELASLCETNLSSENMFHRSHLSYTDSFLRQLTALVSQFRTAPSNISNTYPKLIQDVVNNHQKIKVAADVMRLGALCYKDAESIISVLDSFSAISLE